MRINLLDIGEDGHEFKFKWKEEKDIDGKVSQAVENLKDFSFRIFIQKTGDIYTTTGDYTLAQDTECSLCAEDIKLPIKNKFTEFLMNETKADQKGHAPHSGLNIENEQDVTFVTGHELDMGEFIAEMLALAVPLYPRCADTAACEARQKDNQKYMEKSVMAGHPAFSVLSKLKKQ